MRTNSHPFSSVPAIKSSAKLPAIVAILKKHDSGEVGNAHCPHCGAEGRYTFEFLCEDGVIRGAMAGCIRLFPMANKHQAKLIAEAYRRQQTATEQGKKLASWWSDMITACDNFATEVREQGFNRDRLNLFYIVILDIEARRQAWLKKNGYHRH